MSEQTTKQPPHEYQRYLQNLPADWERKVVRRLGTVVGGGTPSRDVPSFWRGTIPWATPGEVSGNANKFLHDTREHISASGLAGSGANLLPAGSLMVTTRATLGARAINAVPMATNQGFKSIVFNRAADAGFYRHLFEKVQTELARRASGTTFLEISGAEFASIEVPSPCPDEKHLIAEVLDTLETAIHETETIIAKLKAIKQGLQHDLLTRGIDANGELRPHQADAPHLYQKSQLGWIPTEWDTCELGSLVDPARPVVYGILMPGYGYPGGVPVVKVKDIIDDDIQLDDLLLTSPQIDSEYGRSRLRPGDLLFTIRGTVGRMALVPEELKNANITQDTARLAIKFIDARFAKACLSMHAAARFVAVNTLGVAVQGINLRDVRRIPLPRPGPDEAREIADRIDGATERVGCESRALNKLTLAKFGLMDDLLTGRVRVTALLAEAARQEACA
ncbi:MAG TPA: restriction endonuclease subunit S [Terriglobales bacterium]|nr:restriction endonuclease subunit S [Terriglobales bacterium]